MKSEVDFGSESYSTVTGYVNRNNQRNNGRTEIPGNDYNQMMYSMECLNCGEHYLANGSDIWQRRCPFCQNGVMGESAGENKTTSQEICLEGDLK